MLFNSMVRYFKYYSDVICNDLMKENQYSNIMSIPKLSKIVLSITTKDLVTEPKLIDSYCYNLMLISGQKPAITTAKKSIATFKLREGMQIGCKVTLRRSKMYEFLDRFVNIVLPRVRDFKGLNSNSFDGNGNFSLGLRDIMVFPEVGYDKVQKPHGLNLVIATTAKTDSEAKSLLQKFYMPFV